jgi:hypothetical protein
MFMVALQATVVCSAQLNTVVASVTIGNEVLEDHLQLSPGSGIILNN